MHASRLTFFSLLVVVSTLMGGCRGFTTQAQTPTPLSMEEALKLAPPPQLTGRVVYHLRIDDLYQVFAIDLESGDIKQLTFEGENLEPAWSPDGRQIAYACNRGGTKFELCLMNADGSNPQQLTQNEFNDWNPRWSPDGKFLVYTSSEFPYAHLHVLELATGVSRRLLVAEGNEGSGRWSPDGQRILYMSDRGGYFNLYAATPDGTRELKLTDFGRDDRGSWSPDGKQIVFVRTLVSSAIVSIVDLFIADADGKNPRQLTNDQLVEGWPTFSPDGKWILCARSMGEGEQLVVIPVAGGAVASLYEGGVLGSAPDWTP